MCGVNTHFMKHKNAQLRYNTLDRCFRSTSKKYDIDKLLIECNKALNEQGYDGVQKTNKITTNSAVKFTNIY